MTNQLETAKEWLSDLNKIIDKTDNERTKERRDVLEWLVESVEETAMQDWKTASKVFVEMLAEEIEENKKLNKNLNDWKEAFYLLKKDHELVENFQTGEWQLKLESLKGESQ